MQILKKIVRITDVSNANRLEINLVHTTASHLCQARVGNGLPTYDSQTDI